MLQVPQAIKNLLHQDHCQKNIRIHFPNGERTDICNDLIVKDTIQFTESLCSQDKLKFGLCEASSFECETVGVGNIKGAQIEVYCEIYCQPSVSGSVFRTDLQAYVYPILYGIFTVESSQRQADMIHRRIIAYSEVATRDWNFSKYELLKSQVATSSANDVVYDFAKILFSNSMPIEDFIDSRTPAAFAVRNEIYNDTGIPGGGEYVLGTVVCTPPEGESGTLSQFIASYDAYMLILATHNTSYHDEDYTNQLLEVMYDLDIDEFNRMNTFLTDFCKKYKDQGVKQIVNSPLHKGAMVYADTYDYENLIDYNTGRPKYPTVSLNDAGLTQKNTLYVYPYLPGYTDVNNKYVYIIIPKKLTIYKDGDVYEEFSPYSNPEMNFVTLINQNSLFLTVPKEQNGASYYINYADVKFKDFVDSFFECAGVFGRYTRTNQIEICDIKQQFGLRPNTSLYPGLTLYPSGVLGGSIRTEDYQSCWYDDEYTKPFGAVSCSYTDSNNNECLFVMYLDGFDENSPIGSYQTYDLSDNAFIAANIWSAAEIQAICETVADAVEGVTYMAVDFIGRGLPYVEAGDTFEILTRSNDSITTIVLNRTLSGDQTLTDNYKSV